MSAMHRDEGGDGDRRRPRSPPREWENAWTWDWDASRKQSSPGPPEGHRHKFWDKSDQRAIFQQLMTSVGAVLESAE